MATVDRDSIQEQSPLLGKEQPGPINDQVVPLDEAQEKVEYLSEAFEEFSSKQGSESTKYARTCNSKCCKNDPFKLESIKKAKKIGIKIILKSVFRNLFHKAIVREIFIYLSIVVLLVSTSFSLVSIVHDTQKTNATQAEKKKILKVFDYVSFGVSVLGSLFSLLDIALYLRHRGCRVLKRTCKCQELVQPGDEEKAECFNDSCACEGTCSKGCTTVMDIVRIVVLETIFYPNLLLKLFQVIVILADNNYDFNSIHPFDWFMASLNFCSVIIFVYLKRVYIFFGVIRSIRKLKTRVNKKCEGVMFIITFFMYMCALMFLQLLMIIIIVGRFYYDYKQYLENDWIDYITGGINSTGEQFCLWYMMIFAYLMPLIGMPMFFFVHQFWTLKLPVDVVRDLMSELQTKGSGRNIRKNKTDEMVEQVMNHLGNDQFINDYDKLNKIPFYERLLYPFFSPTRAVVSSLYIGLIAGFAISSMYGGPTLLLALHIAVVIIACSINVYATNVGSLWVILITAAALWIIIFIIIIIHVPLVVWVVIGLVFLVREQEPRRKNATE
uniref:Uncharacterized protein n=1 Tax=Amphimedon queenslandica TaxID=400682 RepID=A0A1X7TWM7_AMPQE